MSHEPPPPDEPRASRGARGSAVVPYALSVALVALATVVAAAAHLVVSPTNLAVLYLAAVVIAALYLGRGPAILAAFSGVLALDVFFVPPRLTFSVADTEYVLTFIGLLVVGIIVSSLTSQVRDQASSARRREAETRALYEFSRDLAGSGSLDEILSVAQRHLRDTFEREAVILLPVDGALTLVTAGPDLSPAFDELEAARWSYLHGEAAGRGTDIGPTASLRTIPLKSARGVLGVLGVPAATPGRESSSEQRRLLEVFASLVALAIERTQLAEAARRAEVLQATEKLHTALLDAVSHDLRTPLVAITGALTALEDDSRLSAPSEGRLDAAARAGLLSVAREEAGRLNRIVGDLLDMTRLGAGALMVRAVPTDVEEIVGSALARLGDRLGDHAIGVRLAPDLPAVAMDAVLMVQVLVNLLDNAAKHAPIGTPIEVWAEPRSDGLIITVADHGPGVPNAELERIFDKFHRVEGRGGGVGTGLGLAICKGIVEAHGGCIEASNRLEGGLAIAVRLPSPPPEHTS